MAQVRFLERSLEWRDGESLLDCLERHGADIPSSCRSGACHSCLVRVTEGPISPVAQLGLKETWKAQRLALACMSTTPEDVTVAPSDLSVQVSATVEDKRELGRDVVRLKLRPGAPFPFRAGQYVNLTRSDGLTRSYSVASLESDGVVELHVRVVPDGRMSSWVKATLKAGDTVSLRGPTGDCLYVEGRPDQPLLLVGTGTGLAPLVGIARDALAQKHRGSITLVHGGRGPDDLYLDLELRRLAKQHANFRYLPALSQGEPVPGTFQGRVDAVVKQQFPSLAGFRVFLCGSPAMVKDARALAYALGAALDDILADSFIAAPPPKAQEPHAHALPVLPAHPPKKFEVKTGTPRLQKLRFTVQAAIFAGFLVQGLLYYLARLRPVGSMLPFMAYDSLGHLVVSSTLVLWATMFALIFVLGRFACGWLCPLGFIQDLGEKVLKALKVPLRRPVRQSNTVRFGMAAMVLGHFVVMPVLAAPVRVWQLDWLYREPWLLGFPFRVGLFALDLVAVFVVLGLVLPYFFGPRPYCKLVCETGYLMDLTSRFAFGRIRRNEGFERDTCLSCQRCTNICPQGINVFEEVHLFDRVVNGNCITCLQCVNTCPNDTIVYSLRKKASDTSRVTGYLAALQTRAEDLPRYALTGLGVFAGGAFGFLVLPPSYFHTYAMFASLGGLTGFLAWRAVAAVFAGKLEPLLQGAPVSQVEREKAARIVPLTTEERLGTRGKAAQGPGRVLAVAAVVTLASGAAVWALWRHVPSRIGTLDELPSASSSPEQRRAAGTFFLGVPTETSAEVTQATYAGLRDVLADEVGEAKVFRAESYGALAYAVEHGRVDAAFLPGASTYALLKRTRLQVDVLAQAQHQGATTYTGLLVARPGFAATTEALVGARVAFVQPDSLSGYLAPVQWLKTRGVRLSDLGEVIFSGTHARALSLLQSGRVDVAATFDSVVRASPGGTELVELARFENLPNTLLVTRPGMPEAERQRLLEALLRIWADDGLLSVRRALADGAAMDALVPASVDGVQSVGDYLEE
ncbi:MAG: PhnD/SsuA/transferrin family substrate-binding protein [Myxococcaceae bacterium]|nr:PhnD/SsuA/transferrin family substrate-binding protein [Myxococcaceae bacterium]